MVFLELLQTGSFTFLKPFLAPSADNCQNTESMSEPFTYCIMWSIYIVIY